MSDKIKANRQAIEYYKVAQELLELATHDASDFIDDYEDSDISGLQFKRESSGWVSHLDDIIEDLKGKPDPLNLLPKATMLRKQLSMVASRPADDISYDMQHAAGSPSQSKERFWNRISNMFDSVTSAEPAIIRAPKDGALDVFEQPKAGFSPQRQGNVARNKPQVSNIPDKPKEQIPRRGKPDVNQFVRPTYGPKVEVKPEIVQEVEEKIEPHIRQDVDPIQKKSDLAERIRKQQLEQDKLLQQAKPVLDTSLILMNAAKAADKLAVDYKAKGDKLVNSLLGISTDAENMKANLLNILVVLKEYSKANNPVELRSLQLELRKALLEFSEYAGDDLLRSSSEEDFKYNYDDRMMGNVNLGHITELVRNLYDKIMKTKGSPLLKPKANFEQRDLDLSKTFAQDLRETAKQLDNALEFLSNPDNVMSAVSDYELKRFQEYRDITKGLLHENSDISKLYIEKGIFPKDLNDDASIVASIQALRSRIHQDGLEDRWDSRPRDYNPWSGKSYNAFKAKQSKELTSLINLIEDQIESPFEHNDVDWFMDNADTLYAQMDQYSRVLEKEPTTARAANSLNKLKNKVLRVARNTAQALEPEYKGEIISASQNAVQQLELIVENNKPTYAPSRQSNLTKDKPKVDNIPIKPKQNIRLNPGDVDHNTYQHRGPVTVPRTQLPSTEEPEAEVEDNNVGYLTAEQIATIAIRLAADIDMKSNATEAQSEYFIEIFNNAKGIIEKSKIHIRANFMLMAEIADSKGGKVKPGIDIQDNISREVLIILGNVQALVSNIQLNRRAIAMFEPKARQSINDNLSLIGKYQEELQSHLDKFKGWDFSDKNDADLWMRTVTAVTKKMVIALQNIAQALVNVTSGYDMLSREIRVFAGDITDKDGFYNHFIHEHSKADTKEKVIDAIFDSIGSGRNFMKSLIANEKYYRPRFK